MAQRVSPAQIEEIIDKNDIVSVVSEYVKLKRSGSNYTGLCPFHMAVQVLRLRQRRRRGAVHYAGGKP